MKPLASGTRAQGIRPLWTRNHYSIRCRTSIRCSFELQSPAANQMKYLRPFLYGVVTVTTMSVTGCATFCSLSDTEMSRPCPYSGIRATITDWDGRVKPWDANRTPRPMRVPTQIYFRTIDVPLSLIADTVLLPLMLMFESGERERQLQKRGVAEPSDQSTN